MPIRALIVDDEPLARDELRRLLSVHADVTVVGEAESVDEARRLMERHDPDVVFLDVQLIGESGFALAGSTGRDTAIAFVTAHAEHAVHAFDIHACDYLLKPVEPRRLADTIERVRASHRARLSGNGTPLEYDDQILLRSGGRQILLPVNQIVYITASGDYTRVTVADGSEWETGKPLREWQGRLPSRRFARVHRSTIVNLSCVARIEAWSHYSYLLYLTSRPTPLALSRRYAAVLKARLG
jgi:two-component system LytT family response regulator